MTQYDDHIWLTVNGEAWAIKSINRRSDWPQGIVLHLWRGYAPDLEFLNIWIRYPDRWVADYVNACAKALAEQL